MKILIKFFLLVFFISSFGQNCFSNEIIKVGLVVPLSGEFKKIGQSILNSARLAVNKIDNKNFVIMPRDSKSDPIETLKVSKDLNLNHGVEIIVGPVFKDSAKFLNQVSNVTFFSLSNILEDNHSNIISSGVNAISQFNAIDKFLLKYKLERTILLIPNSKFKNEVENALKLTEIKIKDKFFYDTDPTILTSQIEKVTRYPQRKQNLLDEIKRVKNSNDPNKEKKLEILNKKDTIGGINFDSVVIADFDQNLRSVATSLLYTDVSSKRVQYISLNQWFDETLTKDETLQPIYFPSVNKKNFEQFKSDYANNFGRPGNKIAFLSYDIVGLIYYLIYKNDFIIEKKIFNEKSRFKGKIGTFEIENNVITHDLSFYSAEHGEFKKIF